jgi:arylsulfatase A-like enzyme
MQRLRIMTSVLLLGLAACGASDSSSTPGSDIPRGGNVLLISLDTLRADALSSYGNPHLTSPVLDKLAASGLRFEEVLAQAPNTATSHASLFTGVYPWTHRVSNVSRGDEKFYSLPDDFVTLAEAFDQQGYATAAFTDGGPFSPKWDLLQGFRHTRNQLEGAKAKVQEVLGHLDANADDERPWFVFMHTYEVHQPYMPPVEWAERFHDGSYDGPLIQREKEVRSELERAGRKTLKGRVLVDGFEDFSEQDIRYLWEMYLGAVAYTDYQMGLLFDGLRERGLYDDTLIVITSDHGEEFGEHGRFGHSQVYHETLSVPLLVHLPEGSPAAWAGTVIPERVSLVDVHASLMDFADVSAPFEVGYSVFEGLRTGYFPERTSFAVTTEGFNSDIDRGFFRLDRSAHSGDRAVIMTQKNKADHRRLLDVSGPTPVGQTATEFLASEILPKEGSSELTGSDAHIAELHALVEEVTVHMHTAAEDRKAIIKDESLLRASSIDEATQSEMEALGYLDSDKD